jgi:succinylglutamate desuccinylase
MWNEISTSFAKGDFSSLANSFLDAGFAVQQPYAGVLQICSVTFSAKRLRLLISVGVHGDETAPIEMLALLLERLCKTPHQLAVDLMIVVGNLPAIAQGKRFIETDLNRLFTSQHASSTGEAERAKQLMHSATQFFHGHAHKWHLDLHTAIRASAYPTFAIIPGVKNPAFIDWLGTAGIAAVVLSPTPSVTFSSYTYAQCGAVSCTAELGRVGKLGANDLTQFATTERALDGLLRFGIVVPPNKTQPDVFCIQQELIKHSEAFQFTFDKSTQNFTEFAPNTILATDGAITYSVGPTPEYVLFPNPDVQVGLRAALMAVRVRST